MQIISAITLFSALASTSLAFSDVYAYFTDGMGSKIHNANFIIGTKDECINVANATKVGFSQTGPRHTAKGPFCAKGYKKPGCHEEDKNSTQMYYNVPLDNDKTLELGKVAGFESLIWSSGYCPDAIDGSK